MLYFVRKKVISVYVYRCDGKNYRVTEEVQFNFQKKQYVLKSLKLEEIKSLKGGEQNE